MLCCSVFLLKSSAFKIFSHSFGVCIKNIAFNFNSIDLLTIIVRLLQFPCTQDWNIYDLWNSDEWQDIAAGRLDALFNWRTSSPQLMILTSERGRCLLSTSWLSMASTISLPFNTSPNTTCFLRNRNTIYRVWHTALLVIQRHCNDSYPSRWGAGAVRLKKVTLIINW